jgi:predicted transcriptional regulator
MTRMAEEAERAQLELGRLSYELSQARLRLTEAVVRASEAGLSQRAIAAALGTNQVAVHRMLNRHRDEDARLPARVHYDRADARFHYELHREIARHVLDGDVRLERAEAELERMRSAVQGASADRWLQRWAAILRLPPERMVAAFLVGGEAGEDLRQVSPLLGIVSEDERTAALNRAYSR